MSVAFPPELIPTVLYEDASLLALNKPSGLMIHADGRHTRATLVDWIEVNYPNLTQVGESQVLLNGDIIRRPGIVHRLDAETSGVILVAKTQEAYLNLKKQFADRETQKTYRAFVQGIIGEERGVINKPIGSARGGMGPRSARTPHGTVRDATTIYRVIVRGKGMTYVEAFPKTGRTHQIRVHFAAVQHPLVADPLYGGKQDAVLGFKRLALHAYRIRFTNPETGEEMTIEAPLPTDFVAAESALRGE